MNAVVLRQRRAELEARIEEMIALLDLMDGDPDLEETGDEHDYNRLESGSGQCSGYPMEDDEPNGDDEPWLGWTERLDQTSAQRMAGGTYDGEEDAGEQPEQTRCEEDAGGWLTDGLQSGGGRSIAVAMLRRAGINLRMPDTGAYFPRAAR
jgi:hypothetical protein